MAKLTRSNVAYDLDISPHRAKMTYVDCELVYVFSSELYRQKFFERLNGNREKINASLSNRFGFKIVNEKLCDLKLYTTVEKRGFLLFKDGRRIECLNAVELVGQTIKINS